MPKKSALKRAVKFIKKPLFLNIVTFIFLGAFTLTLFEIAISKPSKSQNSRFVKSHPQFSKSFSGIASVIDGDSIRVGENEVRLVGIDAPEYLQTCFDENNQEYFCGKASHVFLLELAHKKEVECFYSSKDRYNRFLAKCFVNKISINEELLKSGMAVIYDFNESEEKMENLELEAKKQKLGIWRGAFQLPKDYRKSHPRK